MEEQTKNGLRMYVEAKDSLGQALSDGNRQLGCAISVNAIALSALGEEIGGGASTARMYDCLVASQSRFKRVDAPLPGDIIISPTGTGNGSMPHGHVGIVGKFGILSNNSENGLFEEKWKLDSWKEVYGKAGGFPVDFFRVF